jgi:hypothetical protein
MNSDKGESYSCAHNGGVWVMESQFYSFISSALVESCIGRLNLGQPATVWLGDWVNHKTAWTLWRRE